jgi:polyisoprenoid-binding protein YceI
MSNVQRLAAVIGLVVVVVVGVVAYSVLRTPEAASGPITPIPLATSAAAPAATSAPAAAAATDTPATEAAPTTAEAAPTTAEAAPTAAEPTAAANAAPASAMIAQIISAESEARFIIDEVLNNAPKTVIGSTKQVAGEIAVDAQNLANTRIGVIQVNARDLATDSSFRDRAIKNRILNTDQFEFITFTPTQITGLPESGAVGQEYTFQIMGDLTIRDVTKPVTFEVKASAPSADRFAGTAQTTIRYADFNIAIPQVPQVASVAEEVRLEIDFVAATS